MRDRSVGRSAPRVRGLTPTAVPDALIKAALEHALEVARQGEAATPKVPAPPALRPLLKFSAERLTRTALATIRRTLDNDASFRERALEAAEEEGSPRASWIFLQRPEGWEDELDALAAERAAAKGATHAEAEERNALRRLKAVEESLRRAEAQVAATQGELEAAATALAAERKTRRSAEEQLAAQVRKVSSLEGERDSARRRADDATVALAALETELTEARTSLAELDARRRALEAEVELAQTSAPDTATGVLPLAAFDPEPVGRAVAEAAAAAGRLAASLTDAARALGVDSKSVDRPSQTTGAQADEARAEVTRPARPPRRQPAKLPPAVLDDSPEAAAHLMRIGGAILLVDGYNATLSTWPGLSLIEQRNRLIDALAELSARTGVEPVVVFDGDEQAMTRPGQPRRPVKVRFTHADVEADDVILDLVTEVALHRPVIVASDDRRVRDGAHERGANVVSNAQLFSALGRQR